MGTKGDQIRLNKGYQRREAFTGRIIRKNKVGHDPRGEVLLSQGGNRAERGSYLCTKCAPWNCEFHLCKKTDRGLTRLLRQGKYRYARAVEGCVLGRYWSSNHQRYESSWA